MKRFTRRNFLRGAGAAIALPFFASLRSRTARAADPVGPRRFIGFYLPCGIVMNNFTPADEGVGWTPSPILMPLVPYRNNVLVASGLNNTPGRSDGGGDHAAGTGSFLTCVHVRKTSGADISNGISLDQALAPTLSAGLAFPSLELGTDQGSSAGDCDTGYSCAYTSTVAWANATTPLPKQTNPAAVFDRLFAGYDPDATAAEIEKRRRYRTSVLDTALADATSLNAKLGRTDQVKLDQYMTSVRELEERVNGPITVCEPGTRPDQSLGYPEKTRAMLDLIAIAMECDLTRVATFMLGNAGSGHAHTQIGISEGHHQLSHHQGSVDSLNKLTQINGWEMEQLAYLLGKLEAIDDGNGVTGLTNSIVFCSSEIEDGDAHRHTNLPVIVAGSAGNTTLTGTHRRYNGEPLADLFIALAGGLGAELPSFGDNGTGPLTGIRVG